MDTDKPELLAPGSPTVAIDVILWLRRYGVYILLTVAIIVLAIEVLNFYRISKLRKVQEAWIALQSASSPGAIETSVLGIYHTPNVDAQAYLKIGRLYLLRLSLGAQANKPLGLKATHAEAIAGAKLAFKRVISDYPTPIINKISAELGLALVYEDAHDWAKAAAIYQSIIREKTNPTADNFVSVAKFRLTHLDQWAKPILLGPAVKLGMLPATAPAKATATRP